MFKTAEKTELSQISLTGIRAIVLIGLLIVKPRSLEEIKQAFIDLKIMEESHSDDILRIDLNTVKIMGCEISRACAKTNHKYVLSKHPFALKISENEIKVLKKVYNSVKQNIDLTTLIEYDALFKKIAFYVCDDFSKEALLGISQLKYYDTDLIKDLMADCKHNRTIELTYQKTGGSENTEKEIVAQELVCKNGKIYLYGFDLNKNKSVILNLKRITSILARHLKKNQVEPLCTKIRFSIKNINPQELEPTEEIIEQLADGYVVEGTYHNEFVAIQRVLSFGANCIVLEPADFKNTVIEKIKEMRKIYEH